MAKLSDNHSRKEVALQGKKADQFIAASLTNAFFLNALLYEQKGIEVALDNKELLTKMTKEINAVYMAFQEVVKGLNKEEQQE